MATPSYPTKQVTAGFALTGVAVAVAVVNAAAAFPGLSGARRNGHGSPQWVRASTLAVVVYLALLLGKDIRPQLHLRWYDLAGDESFAQLSAFSGLAGYVAAAVVLQAQFKLAFELHSIGDRYAHRVALALCCLSLAVALAHFVATQVWMHLRSSSSWSSPSSASPASPSSSVASGVPAAVHAVVIPQFLANFVLFLTSATTLIPNNSCVPRATGSTKTVSPPTSLMRGFLVKAWLTLQASRLLLAAGVAMLVRQTWILITAGVMQLPVLWGRSRPSSPRHFVLISMVFDMWLLCLAVSLLLLGVRVGLGRRLPAPGRRPVPLERVSENGGALDLSSR